MLNLKMMERGLDMTRKHEKMLQDVVSDEMAEIAEHTARCLMNSQPVPWELHQERIVNAVLEVYTDILADALSKVVRGTKTRRTSEQ